MVGGGDRVLIKSVDSGGSEGSNSRVDGRFGGSRMVAKVAVAAVLA